MTKHSTGTREEWLAARLDLLGAEKEHTRRSDDLARRRQELPRVRIDKEYRFETDEGSASLADLFRADAHSSSSRRAHSLRCRHPRIFLRPSIVFSSKESTAMAALRGKTAIVTGASSGVGKATVKALVSEGARVIGVARGEAGLAALRTEMPQGLDTVRADSSEPGLAERLLRETRPDLIVVVGGVRPKMAPIDEQSWEEFSETWNSDMKTAFHFCKGAVALPLRPGSTVVLVSSGAASNGSHLSGGYAGAKRMQWWLAGYAQQRSDRKQLGIRFLAVVPKQLIEGTPIAVSASAAYGAWLGTTGAEFMKRYDVPLDVDKVAAAIVAGLRGDVEAGVTAIGVTGKGVEPIA